MGKIHLDISNCMLVQKGCCVSQSCAILKEHSEAHPVLNKISIFVLRFKKVKHRYRFTSSMARNVFGLCHSLELHLTETVVK